MPAFVAVILRLVKYCFVVARELRVDAKSSFNSSSCDSSSSDVSVITTSPAATVSPGSKFTDVTVASAAAVTLSDSSAESVPDPLIVVLISPLETELTR